jgi:hypothetical protein
MVAPVIAEYRVLDDWKIVNGKTEGMWNVEVLT